MPSPRLREERPSDGVAFHSLLDDGIQLISLGESLIQSGGKGGLGINGICGEDARRGGLAIEADHLAEIGGLLVADPYPISRSKPQGVGCVVGILARQGHGIAADVGRSHKKSRHKFTPFPFAEKSPICRSNGGQDRDIREF